MKNEKDVPADDNLDNKLPTEPAVPKKNRIEEIKSEHNSSSSRSLSKERLPRDRGNRSLSSERGSGSREGSRERRRNRRGRDSNNKYHEKDRSSSYGSRSSSQNMSLERNKTDSGGHRNHKNLERTGSNIAFFCYVIHLMLTIK